MLGMPQHFGVLVGRGLKSNELNVAFVAHTRYIVTLYLTYLKLNGVGKILTS